MQIQKKTKRKPFLFISFIVLLLIVVGVIAFNVTRRPNQGTSDTEKSKVNGSDSENDQKKSDIPSKNSNADVDVTKSTDQIPVNQAASIDITSLSQANGNITYSASFKGIEGNGTCSAQFSIDDAKPVTRVTKASGSVCEPVSIPEMEFTRLGLWTLTIRYYTNDSQVTTSKAIEIK